MTTNWIGEWKNQYGSNLSITRVHDGRIEGFFQSAVDKSIKGHPINGICTGNLIAIAVASGTEGEKIATWTGIFHEGRIETLWHVAVGGKGLWESFLTGSDIFTRA